MPYGPGFIPMNRTDLGASKNFFKYVQCKSAAYSIGLYTAATLDEKLIVFNSALRRHSMSYNFCQNCVDSKTCGGSAGECIVNDVIGNGVITLSLCGLAVISLSSLFKFKYFSSCSFDS